MAEFVGDHPLQFIAREVIDRSAVDADHRVGGRISRRKRIDSFFIVENVYRRHIGSGRERHLLDDIQQSTFIRVGRVGLDEPSTEHGRNRRPATAKFYDFIEAAEADHQ